MKTASKVAASSRVVGNSTMLNKSDLKDCTQRASMQFSKSPNA